MSLAILARNLFGAMPADATRPVFSRISPLMARPMAPSVGYWVPMPVMSMKASSREMGSISAA